MATREALLLNLILEFDGIITDQHESWFAAHVAAAEAVGWSRLDSSTFWRLIRTKGRQADVLPTAKAAKVEEYWARFDQLVESPVMLGKLTVDDECRTVLNALSRHGDLRLITLAADTESRNAILVRNGLAHFFKQFESLTTDPRRRPAELKLLAKPQPRTIVVAATDAVIRSAGSAELVCVGISTGSCTATRLHQAGASIVYKELGELSQSLQAGASDLIRAGLLPRSLDAPSN
jgi:phosphoglycolate phosphatase-like HAD superfamily hydrolase